MRDQLQYHFPLPTNVLLWIDVGGRRFADVKNASHYKITESAATVKAKTLWFNAWRYEGREEAQSALIHAVLKKLVEGKTLAQDVKERLGKLKTGAGRPALDLRVGAADKRTVLIQTDWDYPGVASSFGWCRCECGETDGTVDCPHKTASQMIDEARDFLDGNIGKAVDDPGYF